MGQAFDERSNVLAEAYGHTKKEVFDKLSEAAPRADSMHIRTLHEEQAQSKDCETQSGHTSLGGDWASAHRFPDPQAECRETSKAMLEDRIHTLEAKLAGMKHLLAIVSKIETGSPAEELIWSLLCKARSAW